MKKIESLTKEQNRRLPEYRGKWIAIGLSTEAANRKEAERGIEEAYAVAGLEAPKIVWCGSPLAQGLTRALTLHASASVWDSVRASVWDSVRDSVGASVGDSVGDSGYGQHDAAWVGFYDFFRRACGLTSETEQLMGLQRISENAGWWLPHVRLCWISERHNSLNLNERGRLHKDGGPALAYPDGFSIWALNGIRVSRSQAETPAERMAPDDVLKETNVDIRRELIRKVGVERMLSKLPHRRLHKRGDYEVLRIDFPALEDARYLRMLNPSVGCWHLEGLPRECDTVEKALNWRNQQWQTDAEILT